MSDLLLLLGDGGGGEGEEQEFMLAAAVRAPVAYGFQYGQPGTVIPPLVARLYAREDLNAPIVEFDQSFNRKFQDQLNETGSGSLELLNDDPDLAEVVGDGTEVVRFEINGWAAFTWLVREIETIAIAEGEEVDQTTTLSGPGHIAIFDEALVYPARGPGVVPIEEDRVFNWTSVDYNDDGWPFARQVMTVAQAQTDWELLPIAEDFPTFYDTWLIWHDPVASDAAPIGPCFFRKVYTSSGGAIIYAVIDDIGDVYIDGQLVLECRSGFAQVYTFAIPDLTPGEHTIAVFGENGTGSDWAPHLNPAGVAVQVWGCDSNGQPTGVFPDVVTDSTWQIAAYPPSPPGMTPGEVVIHCITEARNRGCLPPITFAFDEETDSAGNPWPVVTDIATKTGTEVLAFLRELAGTYVDLWLEPATWTLWAWARGQRGDEQTVALTPVTDELDPWSGNLAGLSFKRAL